MLLQTAVKIAPKFFGQTREVLMRIPALFTIALLGIGSVASCAFAQDGAVGSSSSVITAAEYQKMIAASDVCEAFRIKEKIARIDSPAYSYFMRECLSKALDSSSLHAIVPTNLAVAQNTDRHETLSQAAEICRAYVERRTNTKSPSPYAYAVYDTASEFLHCLTVELPQ